MLQTPTSTAVPTQTGAARHAGVVAVIVHYRCAAATRSLLVWLRADAPGLRVIVVANGSGDGSDEQLAAMYADDPLRTVLVQAENRGFGAGCNAGIDRALLERGVERVLLLNPDVEPEPGFLDCMLETAARHRDAAIVGARILSMDGSRVLYENGRIRRVTLTRCQVPAPRGVEEFPTGFVSGACMLIDAMVLRRGLRFDERFFLYVEDLDLCRQVTDRGRTMWVATRAVVRHEDGGTQRGERTLRGGMRPTQLYNLARGKVLFAKKWFGPVELALSVAVAAVAKPLVALIAWRSWEPVAAHLRGVWDGVRAARSVPREGWR